MPLSGAQRPVAVSPGTPTGFATIADRCPTFSWGFVEGAESLELIVYALTDEDLEEVEPVLAVTLPGSANSWTPALEQCLEAGGQYAWWLRALAEVENTEWSSPSLFRVAAGPSEQEFQEALAVVRAYLEDSPEGGEALGADPATAQPSREAALGRDTTSSSTANPLAELLATPNETGLRSDVAATPE